MGKQANTHQDTFDRLRRVRAEVIEHAPTSGMARGAAPRTLLHRLLATGTGASACR